MVCLFLNLGFQNIILEIESLEVWVSWRAKQSYGRRCGSWGSIWTGFYDVI